MQRREDTVEIFSTFIKFEVDRFDGWIRDPKLRRSMKTCLQQIPDRQSKNFWALYWHKVWQTQRRAFVGRSSLARRRCLDRSHGIPPLHWACHRQ